MNCIIACIRIPNTTFTNCIPLRFRSLESYTCKRTAIIERTNNIEINLCFNDFIKSFSSKVFLAVYNSKTLF